ncbi:hypothetical protein ACHAQA_001142 [Verticillium albo-atrum]
MLPRMSPVDIDPGQAANKGPKACTTCAKAKSRCIPGPPDSDKCERCHRLQKSCASQTPAPPRAKKEPRPTRVAELEKRLDELTTQLHAAKNSTSDPPPASASGSAPVSKPSQLPMSVAKLKAQAQSPFNHLFPEAPPEPVFGSSSSPVSPPDSQSMSSTHATPMASESSARAREVTWPTGAQAEKDLRLFQQVMQPLYPFVITPPTMDAEQLASERPFLFKAVVVVASHYDAYRQLVLGDRLLTEVAQAALTKPQKSLDLLQGLQLLIAWFHYNVNSYQLTNLLFLARSMCITLGFREAQTGLTPKEATTRGLEYMRAFLGCYYLNTLVFTTNKRPDAFMNTTYLDGCCKAVGDKAEYPSDVLVVQLFRVQQLSQTITLTLGADSAAFQSMQLPLTMVVQSFQQQLDIFKSSLPEAVKTNSTLLSHIAIAELLLYEIGLPETQKASSLIPHTDRLGLLWSCLNAAKTFMEIRFETSNLQPRFISLNASDWLFSVLVAIKLRTIELPGWDLSLVDQHLPLELMVDRQISDMDEIIERRREGRAAGEVLACSSSQTQGFLDPYERNRQVLSHLKNLAARELNAMTVAAGGGPVCGIRGAAAAAGRLTPGRGVAGAAGVDAVALAGPALATDTMMRELDGSFWVDTFDDPSWIFGDAVDAGGVGEMDWNY